MKITNLIKNSSITSFLNFSIIVLFLTNLWVIFYLASADYAYFIYHPIIKDFGFGNPSLNPEPFKITFYLIYTVIFVLLIWVVFTLIKKFHILPEKFITDRSFVAYLCRFFILLLLLNIFISKLGSFPLSNNPGYYSLNGFISAYSQPANGLIALVLILYFGFMGLVLLESSILQKILPNKRYYQIGIYLTVLAIITFVTFEARFAIPSLDAAYYLGPVWEMTHGKTILTDFPTLYGFLSVLFFSIVYKISHLNYLYLPVVILILYCIEYFICFYLIHKIGKSATLAFLGLFSIITVNYFGVFHNPQFGPLRWIPLFIAAYLFFRFKRIDSKALIFAISLLSLWSIDAGIVLLMSYILTLAISFLLKQITLRRIIYSGVYLFLSFLIIFAFIEAANFLIQHKFINILQLYLPLLDVSKGYAIRPLETHTYFWFFVLIYFSAIIYVFKNVKNSPLYGQGSALSLLLFSANIAFFVGNYYIGESFPHNFISISPFVIFTFFLLVALQYQNLKTNWGRLIVPCVIFILLIIYPALEKKEYLTNEILHKIQRLKEGHIFTSELDQLVKEKYSKEKEFVQKNLTDNPIIIISADDTYLFYLTGKKNLLNINPVAYINTKTQVDISIQNLHVPCPKKIVYDCQIARMCPPYQSLTHGFPEILPIMLSSIENKCQVQYKPTLCTDKLCIGDSQI